MTHYVRSASAGPTGTRRSALVIPSPWTAIHRVIESGYTFAGPSGRCRGDVPASVGKISPDFLVDSRRKLSLSSVADHTGNSTSGLRSLRDCIKIIWPYGRCSMRNYHYMHTRHLHGYLEPVGVGLRSARAMDLRCGRLHCRVHSHRFSRWVEFSSSGSKARPER